MKKILIGLLVTLSLSVVISSCNKYEEGPKVSLRTKKARLSGEWTLDKYLENDVDQTSTFSALAGPNYLFEIEKDGKYTITTSSGTETGTWELGEDKDDVRFSSTNGTNSYRILRLMNKELWLRYTNTNGTYSKLYLKQ